MRTSFRKSIAFLAVAGFASFAAANTAVAQNAGQPPQGWFKVCTKQEDNDICNVQNIRTANTGQLLTAVNLIQITGKVNRAIFQIAVPTGRVIPAGIGLQIDGGGPIIPTAELLARLTQDPTQFSPGALLRPLVQQRAQRDAQRVAMRIALIGEHAGELEFQHRPVRVQQRGELLR